MRTRFAVFLLLLVCAVSALRAAQPVEESVDSSDAGRLTATRTSGAAAGGYAIAITQLARAHQVTQSTALAAAAANDTLHVKVGGGAAVDVNVAAGDSLDTIASERSLT